MDDTRALSPSTYKPLHARIHPIQSDKISAKAPASGNSAWKLFGLARRDKIILEVELLKITNI